MLLRKLLLLWWVVLLYIFSQTSVFAQTIIEANTGRPVKDVWVNVHWTRTTFEHTQCRDSKVVKTDDNGQYHMPFSLSLSSSPEVSVIYKAGYKVSEHGLVRDQSVGPERLKYLLHWARNSECYGADNEANAQPLIEAMLNEAITLIKTPDDTRLVGEICKEIGVINTTSTYLKSSGKEADKAANFYISGHNLQCRDILVKASWEVPQKYTASSCSADGRCEITDEHYATHNAILNKSEQCPTYEQCNELAKYTPDH